MLWKLLGLQKKLDALFDEGWCNLGVSMGLNGCSKSAPPELPEYPNV